MISRASLPKHVHRKTAKGHVYFYFDTGKVVDGKKVLVRLPDPRSREFGGKYAALLGHRSREVKTVVTVPALIGRFQKSNQYRELATSSQANYDIQLRKLAKLMPTAPVAEIRRVHIRRLVATMADTPGAANLFIGVCGALFKFAIAEEEIALNPTHGIERLKMGEHDPWPEHVLQAALASSDSRVRLLTHLLYYTAARINDALSFSWSNITGNRIVFRPKKGEKRDQVLSIPMHKKLRAELEKQDRRGMLIAINPTTGRRYSDRVARDLLQEHGAQFGVELVPHGLRKNAVNALLEADCSVAQTAAISGQTLQLVEHYAKQRDQKKLADSAVLRWENAP